MLAGHYPSTDSIVGYDFLRKHGLVFIPQREAIMPAANRQLTAADVDAYGHAHQHSTVAEHCSTFSPHQQSR